ncbi:MAG: hypothetical protein U0Q22_12760 [Acidimicrobiales bacterium]
MTPRRTLAALALVASPVLLAGCTGAEVQDFFTSHGHPIPQSLADGIATIVTRIENAHPAPDDGACPTPAPSTTTTTAAPIASAKATGGCETPEVHQRKGRRR